MSLTEAPQFSVVMATWGRGAHIVPSIQSVLRQRGATFELLVVGDGCADETEEVVAGFAGQGVRWINLAEGWRSQSGPNNAGIAAARGDLIAYLGHDDIWEPAHLALLAAAFAARPEADFAVSGAVLHNPHGAPGPRVTGLFTDDAAPARHFFPPSSFAHRRSVTGRIGGWARPGEIVLTVDADLLLRAVAAGMRFAATGQVTVHKFASVQRYLSYLLPSSGEQRAMLDSLDAPGHAVRVAAWLRESQEAGRFMALFHPDIADKAPGEIYRQSSARRGVTLPPVQPLGAGVVLAQEEADAGPDWRRVPVRGVRFSAGTARPRYLLPVAGPGRAALRIEIAHDDAGALAALRRARPGVGVPPHPAAAAPWRTGAFWRRAFTAELDLRAGLPSVLDFHLAQAQTGAEGRRGLGIGEIRLEPVG
jgi:hypothetical protein